MERLEPGNVRPQDARLVVAISSRALFDLDESHRIFEEGGEEAYSRHQIEKENEPLAPGVAFPLAKKLLALNGAAPRVEVHENWKYLLMHLKSCHQGFCNE